MFKLIPCENQKCGNYNSDYKCNCELLTFNTVSKCNKFKKGEEVNIEINPELDSFSNPIQGQRK